MDSLNSSEKFMKETLNKKHVKGLVVFRNAWIAQFFSLVCLFKGCLALDIKGTLNKDVLLPCIVEYKDEFNYTLLVINWQRSENDFVVHSFFHGSSQPKYQEVSYQRRTQIFYESLPKGNASLLLRNLTKSDAGSYTCYVILKESTGYMIQQVYLTVEDVAEAISKNRIWISPYAIVVVSILPLLTLWFYILYRKFYGQLKHGLHVVQNSSYEESTEQIIKKYREYLNSTLTNKIENCFARQLLFSESRFSTSYIDGVGLVGKNIIVNANELFAPGNKHLKSRRMLLLGNAGTGKSCLCKWLVDKWLRKENLLYKCIIYVSCKRIHKEISVKKMVEQIHNDLPEVLHMPGVLLILDGLDHLVCVEEKISVDGDHIEVLPEKKQIFDIDTSLELMTLVENIIVEKMLPEVDVLIVSRHDWPINKLYKCNTFILQDLNDASITAENPTLSKSITDITSNPAFVVMMCNLSRSFERIFHKCTSPYELLTSLLQCYLRDLKIRTIEDGDSFHQLAKQSYKNLVEGQQNEATKQWNNLLCRFECSTDFKYQCKILRDMLAAFHCAREIRRGENLKDCLDFWVYGSQIQRSSILLKHAAEEHNTKYYHFIRFFMRLLPNADTLFDNTPAMDDNMLQEITDYFKAKMKNQSDNYEKLKLIHCVFELHDEHVTNELSSSLEQYCLFNTPLNSFDTHALSYFLRNVKLEKLDLRLCELTDKGVKQLGSIVENTKYVLLSSNNLTSKTGILLEEILRKPDCHIEKLALGTNNLGPDGAQALWRSLENNRSLKSLYLYDNNIGDGGTSGMVEHLQANNSLRELHLCLNVFGEKGIKNIQTLKEARTELSIVMRISEDLKLFEYVEEKVNDLEGTQMNYHQEWLMKLLEAVNEDLASENCDTDANPSQPRVDTLIQKIKAIKKIMKGSPKAHKKRGEKIKSKLIIAGASHRSLIVTHLNHPAISASPRHQDPNLSLPSKHPPRTLTNLALI